jgi:uncharacterized membrane protein YfcA
VNDFIDAKTALLVAMGIVATAYVVVLALGFRRRMAANAAEPVTPTSGGVATGFVTNFFDTLGIGSFATTTSIFRFTKMVPDEQIPGTLNVGHALPTIVQALIFTKAVPVDARTLIVLIAAAVAGSWLGAGFVVSWSRRTVQVGMGIALVAAACLMLLSMFQLTPAGGDAIGLSGGTLLFAAAMNFGLGALMTLGIGLYAPCMILVSLLGMNPTTAFPIMMGSCAFLMPVASARFIRENGFNPRAALGLLIGGIPAVLIAALIVKSLPLTVVRWLVVVVVLYTAFGLLRTALRERAAAQAANR